MADDPDIFEGDDPITIAKRWLAEAEKTEPNDANAMALATSDASGLPNVRRVLLKEIEDDAFVFYTNYEGTKAGELATNPQAAFVLHWKTLHRQVRVRGAVTKEDGPQADAYYQSRALQSRIGAWASDQSRPLSSRAALMAKVAAVGAAKGPNPPRPPHWGGYRIKPVEMELWADGAFRLHDRFRYTRTSTGSGWERLRLSP